jgi:hypothetical protein
MKIRYILNNPDKYDSFIFGSSRVNFIDPVQIPGKAYFNMTYSNGVARDHFKDIRLMHDRGVKIRNLLIGIDFLSLLENPKIQENDLLRKQFPESLNEKFYFYTKYLFFRPDWTVIKLAFSTYGIDRSQLLSNGTLLFNQLDLSIESNPLAHVEKTIFQWPGSIYLYNSDLEVALNEVKKIVNFAKEHQINLILFINPTHHITYLNLNLDNYFEALKKLAKITNFYDFSGLNSVAVDNMKFHENSHFRHVTGNMMIARIFNLGGFNIPDDFGRYITTKNIDDQILFHKSLIKDYLESTSLGEDTSARIELHSMRKLPRKPTLFLDRINETPISSRNNPLLITTPWIKIKGSVIDPLLKIIDTKVFVKIGYRTFQTCIGKNVYEVREKGRSYIQNTTAWEILVPTELLRNGIQELKVLVVSGNKTDYVVSDNIIKLNILKSNVFQSNLELTSSNDSTDYHVDFINGINASEFTSLYDYNQYLNLSGWAIDKINNNISGGIIVLLDGKEYQNQFKFEREDIMNYYKNKCIRYAGWGITIPVDNMKEGPHELLFKILNKQRSKYYTSNKKIIFQYIKSNSDNLLKGIFSSNEKTKYSIDEINGIIINKYKEPINISGSLIKISGWAVDILGRKPASKVLVEIDGKIFKTFYGKNRPDVAKYFNNLTYQNSGWEISIPSYIIGQGYHKLKLKIISYDKLCYFKSEKEIILKVL